MKPLETTFEVPGWEGILQSLSMGATYPAPAFLALLEGESEASFEDALEIVRHRRVYLDISGLPQDFGEGDGADRLRREYELVRSGTLFESLEDSDPLKVYLSELQEGLSPEEISELSTRLAMGDSGVAAPLVSGLLPRIVELSREFVARGVMLPDLIQEGSLGLWEQLSDYDKGDFSAFALEAARSAMSCCVVQQARSKGIGQQLRQKARQYQQTDVLLLKELGRNPTKEEIGQRMQISAQEADFIEDMLASAREMDAAAPKEPPEEPPEEQRVEDTAYFQMRQRVQELLSGLDEAQAKLISLRFGLDGAPPMTPDQVAKQLNMTPEEVVREEARALAQLKKQ